MNKFYRVDRELSDIDKLQMGSEFSRVMMGISNMYSEECVTFFFKRGKYSFELPTRIWATIQVTPKAYIRVELMNAFSKTECYSHLTVGQVPAVVNIHQGNCVVDGMVIVDKGKLYFGSVYCDEYSCNEMRVL